MARLLKLGADPNSVDAQGVTALMLAADRSSRDTLKALLKGRALNCPTTSSPQWSPLAGDWRLEIGAV